MPIENEKKYVILETSEEIIASQAEQVLRIEQKYLLIEKGISVRIRFAIIGWNESHVHINAYYLTVKKDVGGQVVEIETQISENDFNKLWHTGKNKVVKTRYLYQGWEIDFFKTPLGDNYMAVAEIELPPRQKAPKHIPELIKDYIIFNVPAKDKRFANKKLGDVKYALKLLKTIKKNTSIKIAKPNSFKKLKLK